MSEEQGAGHLVSSTCKLCHAGWPRVGDEGWALLVQGGRGQECKGRGDILSPWVSLQGGLALGRAPRCQPGQVLGALLVAVPCWGGTPRLCWARFSCSSSSEIGWFRISYHCMNFNRSR